MTDIIAVVSILFIIYTYLGYPAILFILPKRKDKVTKKISYRPNVSVLIPAFNEEKNIGNTIRSLLNSEYPADRLEIIVSSDASTDKTEQIVRSFGDKKIKVHRMHLRSGKFEAQKQSYRLAGGDIILLADANGQFDPLAVKTLIESFSDATIGSVVGKKVVKTTKSNFSLGEGLYWRYESKLRHLESLTGASWIGCEGGITAIRRELLSFDYKSWIAQDYALCCRTFEKGYRNVYEPNAIVFEEVATNTFSEFSRKVRIIVRGIQAFFSFVYLLNPIKYRMFCFQNLSHRLFRWLVPFFLIFLLFFTGLSRNSFSQGLFFGQIAFYLLAVLAGILKFLYRNERTQSIFLYVPLYFTTMNIAALVSWAVILKRFEIWKRTERN